MPKSLEEFQKMKYNDGTKWNDLKKDYRIVNSYEDNAGHMDSEEKLFEYAADIAKDGKKHKIHLLSEKCMCDSCLGVLKQFQEKYPKVKVNAVSNKKEMNAINEGKPWEGREE